MNADFIASPTLLAVYGFNIDNEKYKKLVKEDLVLSPTSAAY